MFRSPSINVQPLLVVIDKCDGYARYEYLVVFTLRVTPDVNVCKLQLINILSYAFCEIVTPVNIFAIVVILDTFHDPIEDW